MDSEQEGGVERDMIPLIVNMPFNGSWNYLREYTGELVDKRYVEILSEVDVVVPYTRKLIHMSPLLKEANALLYDTRKIKENGEGQKGPASLCKFDEEAWREERRF